MIFTNVFHVFVRHDDGRVVQLNVFCVLVIVNKATLIRSVVTYFVVLNVVLSY